MKEIFIICDKVFIFSFIYFNNKILYNDGGDNMDVSNLSIREKIGQKFIVGVNSNNIDVLIDLIKKYYIGGVILYKKNYNNYDEMLSVIKKLKEANKDNKVPLFVAIDQEGGRVNRMPSDFKNIKNIYDLSFKEENLVYSAGKITGEMLSKSGINMNFAPVLDIYEDNGSKVLYKRCFYGDISSINSASSKYINGLYDNGVIPVVKHFPGHGVSKLDSHLLTPYIYNYQKILDKHIKPFENAIQNGIDAIMINHFVIRCLTGGVPASISYKFINEYLRKKYNYNGLVITDEIHMLSHNVFYIFNYMKKALKSGSDIVLVKIKNTNTINVIDRFIKMVDGNKEYEKLVDESVNRIMNVKSKYKINDDLMYDGVDVLEINKKIDELNNLSI